MDKEFVIGMIFEKIDTKKISGKANDFPTQPEGDYDIPLLTAGIENQGLARYAMRSQCPTILSNVISVSANGANSGVVFYHPEEFAVLQDAYAIQVRNYEIPNAEVGLYLTSALYKAVASTHDWNYKAGWNRIKEDKFALPIKVDENGNPIIDDTHFYHDEGFVPDFDYMQERIEELEQERIEELEQYLVATGLNDYELTDEDIETLSLSGFGHYEERDNDGAVRVCKEFKISDLFELQKVSNKLAKEDLSNAYSYPAYSSDTGNNGIIGYTDSPEFICDDETPVYITFGDHTRTLNIARKSFSVLDNVKVLIPCYDNDEVLLYLTSKWRKQIPNLGYARHWKVAKDGILSLPIQTDTNNNPIIDADCKYHPDGYIPDWDFMEKYIKAIEKIVIVDVVRYKDAVISKTKEAVA